MLVLKRYPGQKLTIGDNITIMVIEVHSNGCVQLGIEAPREVPIERDDMVSATRKGGRGDERQADGQAQGQ